MKGHEGSAALLEPPQLPNDELRQQQLEDEFKLDLEGHTLVDPEDYDGRVQEIREVAPVSMDTGKILPYKIKMFEIDVVDPFTEADPKGYGIISRYIAGMEQRMRDDGAYGYRDAERNVVEVTGNNIFAHTNESGKIIEGDLIPHVADRTEALVRGQQNPYTRAWLAGKEVASLAIWRDLVPTAEALGYLSRPQVESIIANRRGESAAASPETVAHHRFVDDAVGIRGRAIAFKQLGINHLEGFKAGSKVKWLSLASGTAEPSILAAKHAGENSGVSVDLTVADIDGKSLRFVQNNANKHQFSGRVNTIRTNILAPNVREVIAQETGDSGQYHVVEAMGFEEYLPQEGDELAKYQEGDENAYGGSGLPQASEFTKRAWEMVKPGGVLMSGNMILQRPQFGFVFGIVDWPLINARSEESILRVYKEAGILDDPNAQVEMYRVRDANVGTHVYNIVKVTKKAA